MLQLLILFLLLVSIVISLFNRKIGYSLLGIASALIIYQGLHCIFFLIAGIVWLLSSAFSIFYDNYGKWLSPLFITSILGMYIVLISNNYLEFLAGWEIMSIPAYAIIGLNKKIDYPAFTFMAFGELSTVLILSAFIYSYSITGNIYFTELSSPLPFIISTFGFIVKMGIFPFLVMEWLPIAHGSAPANSSAILSATMTLMGVYGIIKIASLTQRTIVTQDFGFILLGMGSFSVFFGALYAYVSEHVKGLLAFSTIENNGSILTGIGVYLISQGVLSQFALDVTLVFALAHSIAKTGLFFISGSVEGESLTYIKIPKSLRGKIGGILLASSMSGLLPNIGGVAAWGLLESLFMLAYVEHSVLSIIPIISGSIVAMGEGLATGALIKFISYTQIFKLGKTEGSAKVSIVLLAGIFVLLLGSVSYIFFRGFTAGVSCLGMLEGLLIISSYGEPFGGISPLYVLLLLFIISLVIFGIFGKPKIRRSETWNNGEKIEDQFSSFALANNIRMMLSKLLRTKILENEVAFSADIFWEAMYSLAKAYKKFSRILSTSYMNSSLSYYIFYMILAFIIITLLAVII
jgi:formate hydrogenlyase subunit 3/multisubunit Na+/H+ antiporter MnhD subunit